MWNALVVALSLCAPPKATACETDVEFALVELEKRCGHFFEAKGIDWKAAATKIRAKAKYASTPSEHYGVLLHLITELRDGHSAVIPIGEAEDVKPPEEFAVERIEPSFHLCRNGSKFLVKSCWGASAKVGMAPGMEVTRVNGQPASQWFTEHLAFWRDHGNFSTEQHAATYALTRGLAFEKGKGLEIEVKRKVGTKSFEFTPNSSEGRRVGPAVPFGGAAEKNGLLVGRNKDGIGYIHIPKVYDDLPQRLDDALGSLGTLKGLILDFRGNTGGGCDHDAVLGLFVAKGKTMNRPDAGPIASSGEHPYAGNLVAIVDSMVVSAGETVSGMFKEDGRGYLIGEGPTAGMSGSKEDLDLPSGLFRLHFVVRSNKARFQGGKGIEGVGIQPHEIVPYDAKDLEKGVDTLTARALALLKAFPKDKVPYRADG